MQKTDNFRKHTSKNPLQKLLIDNFFNNLQAAVKDLKADSILDVGCGEGFTLNRLKENGIGKKLKGLEYSKNAIKLGRKIYPDIKIIQGSIYKLPYKNNSFDLVLCTEVLEHLEDPKKALKELARVSKKYLLLSVPNEPYFMLANFLRGKNISRWGNDIEHVQHWTSRGFEKFIKSEKLKIIRRKHPFPWNMILLEKI